MTTMINIQDTTCWCCGLKPGSTQHHGIPQHLKPKKNVGIPICEDCHKKINSNDLTGMYAYAYKIEKISEQARNAANRLYRMMKEKLETKK